MKIVLYLPIAAAVASLLGQDVLFKSDVSLVAIRVQVVGNKGPVSGLVKKDFLVVDNGKVQDVIDSIGDQASLDIVLLFDVSRSMGPGMFDIGSSTRRAFHELRPGDRVAAMAFNTKSWLVFPLTNNLEWAGREIESRISNTHFDGGTLILNALDDAAGYFTQQPPAVGRQRVIIILTDNDGYGPDFQKSVIRHLWEADTTVNGLIIASTETIADRLGPVGAQRMNSPDDINPIADQTGGTVIDAAGTGSPLDEMFDRMRQRYVLYYSMPADKPGRHRTVHVELSSEGRSQWPDAKVLARKGYVVPRQR